MPLIDPNYLRQAAMGRVNQGLLPAVDDEDYAKMLERLQKEREFNITRKDRGNANMLETWPAGEEGTPDYARPEDLPLDKLGLELNSDDVKPKDIVGDLASHDMAQNDPNMTGYYREFERSLTPEQHDRLKEQYQYAVDKEGETRPYEEWYQASGLPAYFRGGAFKQWDNPEDLYTPEQTHEQGRMLEYLKTGKPPEAEVSGLVGQDSLNQGAMDRVNVGLLPAVGPSRWGGEGLGKTEPFDPISAYRGLPPKAGEPTMTTPPDPTIRQRLGRAIAGDERQPGRQWLAEKLTGGTGLGEEGMGAMDLTPLGNVSDALENYAKGDYTGMGVAMMPGPAGRVGKQLLRRGAKEMQEEMRRIANMDLTRDVEISRSRSNYPPEPKGPPGAAPDRSEFSLLRYNAPKGDSARFQALENKIDTDPSVANEIFSLAKDGEEIGRKWYDTEMLRDRFVATLGEERGEDAWREFMWYVGATSTGSKVLPNIRNASHYFVEGQKKLRDLADDMIAGNYDVPESYGHKMQKNQMKNIGRIHAGEWGPNADQTLNPKPRGFFQSLLGNRSNIAADKHFMRLMGMMSDDPQFLHGSAEISKELVDELRAKYGKKLDRYIKFAPLKDAKGRPTKKIRINFNAKKAVKEGPKDLYAFIKDKSAVWDDMPNDNEYKAFERIAGKMAEKMNMTPAQFQASLWMGAAKKTKVDPSSLDTFVNLFNARLKKTAEERGLSEDEVWHRFATKKQALAILGVPAGAAAAGSDDEEPLQPEMLSPH